METFWYPEGLLGFLGPFLVLLGAVLDFWSFLTKRFFDETVFDETVFWRKKQNLTKRYLTGAEPSGRDVHEESQQPLPMQSMLRNVVPRREQTTTTMQSLLGEMSMKKANNHCQCRACWKVGDDIQEESQQPPQHSDCWERCPWRKPTTTANAEHAGRCYPRREPSTTSTQRLLDRCPYKESQQPHCECRACWEMLSKKRASNHHCAQPAGKDVHEDNQQPPMQSMLGEMLSKKRANNHHCAEPAGRDVHEENQQPPMQFNMWNFKLLVQTTLEKVVWNSNSTQNPDSAWNLAILRGISNYFPKLICMEWKATFSNYLN